MLFRGALIGLLVFVSGCVSLRDARLINTRASLETFAAPVKCGPIGFRRVPLKARFGEYVRVTVTSPVALAGRAFIHADGEAGESHEWSTASGDPLVIEARFENDNPDRLTALNVDQPIDVTITGLEAVAGGTCEGAVFTLEHGSLVPPTSEAAWVAELERRGGPELAERRAQEAALTEERRLAHEAAWGKDDEGGLSPEEMMARLMEAEAAKEVAVSRADEWSGWNGTACPRGDACIVSGSVGVEVSVPQPPSVACGGAACGSQEIRGGSSCDGAACASAEVGVELGGGVVAAAPAVTASLCAGVTCAADDVVGSTAQSAMEVGGGVAAARPVSNDSPCVGGSCALNDAAAAPGVADSSCGGARCASGATFEVGGGVAAAPPVFTGSPCAGSACAADDEVFAFGGSLAASEQSATQFPTDLGGGVAAAAPAATGAPCGGAPCAVDGSAAVRASCTSGGCDDALNARVDVAAEALVAEAEAWGSYGDAIAAGGCATGTCAGGVVGVGSGTGGAAPCPPEGSVQVSGAATTTWSEYPSAYGGGGNGAAGGAVGSADEWAPAPAVVETQVATTQHPAPVPVQVPMTSAPCGACVDPGVHMEVDVGLIPAMFGLLDAALSLAPPPVVFPAPPPPRHRARPVR